MKAVFFPLIGRFGNQMFQYAYARAYAEQHGLELHLDPWIGDRVFNLPKFKRRTKDDAVMQENYYQHQRYMIYTLEQVRSWFRIKPEIAGALLSLPRDNILMHRRVGDYVGYGFTVISELSYINACTKHCLSGDRKWITEENPTVVPDLDKDLQFMGDFWRMMNCEVLLRGNSSFSWWAATLGSCRVFSPVVAGVPGGEQHCDFVEGNHPMVTNFDFNSDLHLKKESECPTPNFRSQAGQDRFVWALLPKRFGSFVDLGCGSDVWSNTLALEEIGWSGLLMDIGDGAGIGRKSDFRRMDAAKFDWSTIGRATYDYLSLDVEEATLPALKNIPHDKVRFRIITIEHDAYRFGDQIRDEMRDILTKAGYILICSDVMIDQPFEDWWVCPELESSAARFKCNGKKWHEIV